MAGSGSASSTWAPLRIGLFRSLWIAALVSNVGTWMQTVGAQWLVVNDAHAAILVSLVQTAYTLPAVLFALVGGVLADIFDRARLLVAVLAGMTAAGTALTALTAADRDAASAAAHVHLRAGHRCHLGRTRLPVAGARHGPAPAGARAGAETGRASSQEEARCSRPLTSTPSYAFGSFSLLERHFVCGSLAGRCRRRHADPGRPA